MKRKPNLEKIRVFGCDAFVKIPDDKRAAWDPKSKKMVLVGYDAMTGNFRLYDKEKRCIVIARHVHFEEDMDKYVSISLKPQNAAPEQLP